MDQYIVVEVPPNPTAAAAVLNAQFGNGYVFVAWLVPCQPVTPGKAIFAIAPA